MGIVGVKMFLFTAIPIINLRSNIEYFHLFYPRFARSFHLQIENFLFRNANNQQQESHFGNNLMFLIYLQFKLHFMVHK